MKSVTTYTKIIARVTENAKRSLSDHLLPILISFFHMTARLIGREGRRSRIPLPQIQRNPPYIWRLVWSRRSENQSMNQRRYSLRHPRRTKLWKGAMERRRSRLLTPRPWKLNNILPRPFKNRPNSKLLSPLVHRSSEPLPHKSSQTTSEPERTVATAGIRPAVAWHPLSRRWYFCAVFYQSLFSLWLPAELPPRSTTEILRLMMISILVRMISILVVRKWMTFWINFSMIMVLETKSRRLRFGRRQRRWNNKKSSTSLDTSMS